MSLLSMLTRAAISLVIGIAFGSLWTLANRRRHYWVSAPLGLAFGLLIWIGIGGLRLVPSRPVAVEITSPLSRTEIGGQTTTILGTVSPADSRVMILIHPWDADHWWVQEGPAIVGIDEETNSAVWQAQIVLGEENVGRNEAFEVIALGSQDPLLFDLLVGRHLAEGEEVVGLPVLSQSNSLVLVRTE
jgi:uncharacterized membrane protein (UPF0136 family)